jgi:outer membrane protein OmpA-like peptidoglycan-associated protein
MKKRSWGSRGVGLAVAGLASAGLGCHTLHGAGPHPGVDLLAGALLGPEWDYWHHRDHASEPHPRWCDGDHTFDDEAEHTWDDDPDAHEDGGARDDGAYARPGGDPIPDDPAVFDVMFEAGSAELTRDAQVDLRWLAVELRGDADLALLLRGHSDGSGGEGFDLSDARARSVRDFLSGQGVAPRRIAWVGLGDSRPVAAADSADGRRRNRRVEIVVREREPDPYS